MRKTLDANFFGAYDSGQGQDFEEEQVGIAL